MKFEPGLIEVVLLRRYKRFFADVLMPDGSEIAVHCPNTGSMRGCVGEGWKAQISDSQNPKRKLRYTLERVHNGKSWIGVHPGKANALAEEAIHNGVIVELSGYQVLTREVKYGENSRIDILLEDPGRCYVEVKSVSLVEKGICYFPDAVSSRGLKHLHELIEVKKQGDRAVLLLVVQRRDGKKFRPADHIDPKWSQGLREAHGAGVEILIYRCHFGKNKLTIDDAIPLELRDIYKNI